MMIGGICESPLTIRAIIEWHSALKDGKMLLRDIIDLDATYGSGPDGAATPAPGAVSGEPSESGEEESGESDGETPEESEQDGDGRCRRG